MSHDLENRIMFNIIIVPINLHHKINLYLIQNIDDVETLKTSLAYEKRRQEKSIADKQLRKLAKCLILSVHYRQFLVIFFKLCSIILWCFCVDVLPL